MNNDAKIDAGKVAGPTDLARGQFRVMKTTLSHVEFSAVRWAAARAGWRSATGVPANSMPIGEFFRRALFAQVREVVRTEINKGKSVPPNVAAVTQEGKPDN
ncbi:MAG: hypothetical protein ACLQAH_09075 [Limisphaerales bacterium]